MNTNKKNYFSLNTTYMHSPPQPRGKLPNIATENSKETLHWVEDWC